MADLAYRTDTIRHLTVQDAAARLAVHPETIRRAYRSRRLRTVMVGRCIRILPADLERWQREGGYTS